MSSFIERPRTQCALGGALATINAIDRAVAIVHGAPGCATTADAAASAGSGYWGTVECTGRSTPSTNLLEREIVFGGEQRLEEQLQTTFEVVDADLYAVLTGCTSDIIGDDVRAIVEAARRKGKPVVVAETGGFKGDTFVGHELVWRALVDQFVEPQVERDPKLLNLFGLVPTQDVFWRGDLLEIKRLLGLLGIKANAMVGPFDDAGTLRTSARASENIVLSPSVGVRAAERFQERHGTPFFWETLPIGPTATESFLRNVARRLGVRNEVLEETLAAEKRYYYGFIQHLAELYNDQDLQRNAVIVANSTYGLAVTRFLADDFGWLPRFLAITEAMDSESERRVLSELDKLSPSVRPTVIFESNTTAIRERVLSNVLREPSPYGGSPLDPAYVLGSALDRPLATQLRAGFLAVSFPVVNRVVTDQGYAGFRGGLHLATDILSAMMANR